MCYVQNILLVLSPIILAIHIRLDSTYAYLICLYGPRVRPHACHQLIRHHFLSTAEHYNQSCLNLQGGKIHRNSRALERQVPYLLLATNNIYYMVNITETVFYMLSKLLNTDHMYESPSQDLAEASCDVLAQNLTICSSFASTAAARWITIRCHCGILHRVQTLQHIRDILQRQLEAVPAHKQVTMTECSSSSDRSPRLPLVSSSREGSRAHT